MHDHLNNLFKKHFSPDPFLLSNISTVRVYTEYLRNLGITYMIEPKKPWLFIEKLNNDEITHVLLADDSNKIYAIKGTVLDIIGDKNFCLDDKIFLIATVTET